jgi:hypothetical protein
MQIVFRLLICFANFFLFFSAVHAQAYVQDSDFVQSSISNSIDFYEKYVGENMHLYNGSEYVPYDFHIKGNPYYATNLFQNGSINYDGTSYQNILISYDIVRDEVTTNRYHENFRIKLVTAKIAWFSVLNHFFVRILQDSSNKSIINTGFYDRLYDGKIKLFAKRTKKIQETVTADEGQKLWFEENDLYYVKKTDKYYAVSGKSGLLDIFKDRKKDIEKYWKKNKIRFKDDPENTILKTVEYYDQFKN